jgi:hypothetical protein
VGDAVAQGFRAVNLAVRTQLGPAGVTAPTTGSSKTWNGETMDPGDVLDSIRRILEPVIDRASWAEADRLCPTRRLITLDDLPGGPSPHDYLRDPFLPLSLR